MPGCGVLLPPVAGSGHAYIGSSPACWELYSRVLGRIHGDRAYGETGQLVVDTYAVQHPGEPERRSIQSVALHLITLCLVLERGADPRAVTKIHQRLARRSFAWLEPPPERGTTTVADVLAATGPEEHRGFVDAWAHDVWAAWKPHHDAVTAWIRRELD